MTEQFEELANQCWRACFHEGDVEKVKGFIAAGVDINGRAPCSGGAPLDSAICGGHMDLVRYLVNAGADVNGVGYDDGTPLAAAASQGSVEAVELLLANGADANLASQTTGGTPLHAAAGRGFAHGTTECVRLLLEAGANPNAKTKVGVPTTSFSRDVCVVGETPLHLAAAYGDEQMIQLLIDSGADPSIKDSRGESPLTWFSRHQRTATHVTVPRRAMKLLAYGKWLDKKYWIGLR